MANTQLIDEFIATSRLEKNLSKRTLKAYYHDLSQLALFLGTKSLLKIGISDIRDFVNWLDSKNLQSTSVKRKLATLKAFMKYLEDEKLIEYSPARKLRRKYKTPKKIPRVLSNDEIKCMLVAANCPICSFKNAPDKRKLKYLRDRVIIEILFCTGIRIDELVSLNNTDINIEEKTMIINGKGSKERLIYISSDEVITAIIDYLDIRNIFASDPNAFLVNRFGNRLSVHSIGLIFKAICQRAKLPSKYTPHCLRHSMATKLIENGADVKSVQEILGHRNIKTTEIYLTISKNRKMDVLNRCNQRNLYKIMP